MAKYLGIPLTVSNGNRIPLTAQSNKVENPTFEGTQTPSGVNFVLSSGWRLNNSGGGAAASSSEFTSEGAKIEWPATNPPSSTYLRAWNVSSASNLIVFTKGKAYKMTYTISSSNNDSGLRLENGASIISLPTTVGTHEVDLVADIETFTIIRNNTVSSGATIVVSSVYVKEIAATETPTYVSPELVPDSDLLDSSFWNVQSNWTMLDDGVATHAGGLSNLVPKRLDGTGYLPLMEQRKYVATFTVDSIADGFVKLWDYQNGATYLTATTSGTYTKEFTASSIAISLSSDSSNAVVSYFSVKEVSSSTIGDSIPLKYEVTSQAKGGWYGAENASIGILGETITVTPSVADAESRAIQKIKLTVGKKYLFTLDYSGGDVNNTPEIQLTHSATGISGFPVAHYNYNYASGKAGLVFTPVEESTWISLGRQSSLGSVSISYSNISVKEFSYTNYLQVADGGFKKSIKEGDVVFNTSTGDEGVVKDVVTDNVLLMSNDNFSTEGVFFNVFAANNDTRGNEIIRTDKYITSEYDENPSNPQESSFWFAGGSNADKLTMSQLMPATNTFFVANVIEEYVERLNNQSATRSRLDIPLDAFRDHQYGELLMITDITLS